MRAALVLLAAQAAFCGPLTAGSMCTAPIHFAPLPPKPVAASNLWSWANQTSSELLPVSLLIANAGMGTTGTRAFHQFLCDRGYRAIHFASCCNMEPQVRATPPYPPTRRFIAAVPCAVSTLVLAYRSI
jgi:hypothetical protein